MNIAGAKYHAEVIERDVTNLKPHPENPRTHSEDQIKAMCDALVTFGYAKISIAVQKSTDYILAGHGVVESLIRIGMLKVPVYVYDLPDDLALAFMLSDNKLGEMSFWDDELLAEALTKVIELPDIEIDETGFTLDEYKLLDTTVLDSQPTGAGTQPRLDQKKPVVCPECGHEFVPR